MGLLDFLKRSPRKKHCAHCGQPAAHGYSQEVESRGSEIVYLCVRCLSEQLRKEYSSFVGRSIVIAPAAGLPCYVFLSRDFLLSSSTELEREIDQLLAQIKECALCGNTGCCLWLESRGLTGETLGEVLDRGLGATIFAWGNPRPLSLCGTCTAQRINTELASERMEFFEICGPHGAQEGIVIPMAY